MWTPIPSLRFVLAAVTTAGALTGAGSPASAQEAASAIETASEPPAVVAPTPHVPEQVDPMLADRVRAATAVVRPSYMRQPAPEFPDRAVVNGVSEGTVTLKCVAETTGLFSGCEVLHETPAEMGFGQAAINSMRRARIRPMTVDGVPEASFVQLNIRFSLPAEPEANLAAVIENPTWRIPPRTAVPNRARAAGVNRAAVLLDCWIFLTSLRSCVVKQEDPTGYGFGAAAVRAAQDAEISWEDARRASPTARAVFTVYFESP